MQTAARPGPCEPRSGRTNYRYFPDPDLPPVFVTTTMRAGIEASLPELPDDRKGRFERELGLPAYDAGVLTEERPVADYFEAVLSAVRQKDPAADLAGQRRPSRTRS